MASHTFFKVKGRGVPLAEMLPEDNYINWEGLKRRVGPRTELGKRLAPWWLEWEG